MNLKGVTPYHAKYLAAITRRKFPLDSWDRLIPIVYDADIELHVHQLAAAYSVLNTPMSKGSILADEEGLGKSIEASIVLSWLWHTGQKKLLVISPVSQVKQWRMTLLTKFGLPSVILDKETFDTIKKRKNNPFDQKKIIICSFKTAYEKESFIQELDWDFVVIDEAHRMKNIYDIKSSIGDSIRMSVSQYNKLLITSTPFQSTMKRLFRLANLVDRYTFGDQRSFNYQFVSITDDIDYKDLSNRLKNMMKRTTAKRLEEYIGDSTKYEIEVGYEGSSIERDYITAMQNYFIDSSKFGLPSDRASLQALGLFKQMTLSPKIAMEGLSSIDKGLDLMLEGKDPNEFVMQQFMNDIESLEWKRDEWYTDSSMKLDVENYQSVKKDVKLEKENLLLLREYVLAVQKDSRLEAFLVGLKQAEDLIKSIRTKKRIVVYTESLAAQKYLVFNLRDARKKGVYFINGSNLDPENEDIYQRFIKNKRYKELVTGIEDSDRRTAIITEFQSKGRILVATDTGLADQSVSNCYVVINYDLPLDPYLTQLRLSKVHGHASPNDLYIVNIVNRSNEFEVWNYDKLADSFDLFKGKYGRSDTPVGAIGAGTDYAMLVFGFYMKTSSIHLVERSFRKIGIQINEAKGSSMQGYYKKLLEKTKRKEEDEWDEIIDEFVPILENVLRCVITIYAIMSKGKGKVSTRGSGSFNLLRKPFRMSKDNLGLYGFDLIKRPDRRKFYINSSFGGRIIDKALRQRLTINHLRFSSRSVRPQKKSLKELKKKSGVLNLKLVNVKGMQEEEHLIFTGLTDDGEIMTQEQCKDMMSLSAKDLGPVKVPGDYKKFVKENIEELIDQVTERDIQYINEFGEKLDTWIADRILVHKKDLRLIMTQKRKLHRRWINSRSERKKAKLESELLEVGVFRRKKRRYIRKVIKYSSIEREEMVQNLKIDTKYQYKSKNLFTIRWELR